MVTICVVSFWSVPLLTVPYCLLGAVYCLRASFRDVVCSALPLSSPLLKLRVAAGRSALASPTYVSALVRWSLALPIGFWDLTL
eukprot:scaffold214264_cov23-Tisochrysis_lutea.AAC.1